MVRSFLLFCGLGLTCSAWDYDGHRLVNQIALAALPTNFPSFVKTAASQERIAFLAGEPDRWRNSQDLALRHYNGPDHYIDLEDLKIYGLSPETLPHLRYDFVARVAEVRAAHPERFPAIDPTRNEDHTRQLVGYLPWAIAEYYSKLKSAFSYLKVFGEEGTTEEIQNAQQNVLYIMGIMGHYVGDATQPLHTTRHFNGWIGDNPKHYATNLTFHGWVDGGYMRKISRLTLEELQPRIGKAQTFQTGPALKGEDIFPTLIQFLLEQHALVEPLYQLNKEGSLSDDGGEGSKGREFMIQQLVKGGRMLSDLWSSAWQHAPPDNYLRARLIERKAGGSPRSRRKPAASQ